MTMIAGVVRRLWAALPRLKPGDPQLSRAIGLL